MIKLVVKFMRLAIDMSIARQQYAGAILRDLRFYKEYLDRIEHA